MYYSEIKYYTEIKRATVKGIKKVQLQDQYGVNVILDEKDLSILNCADKFTKTEKASRSEIIKLLEANPRTACSIYYRKKDSTKGVRAFAAEKKAKIEEIQKAKVSEIPTLLEDLIDNPLTNIIPGEMRLIKGYHEGNYDVHSRLEFTDMEDPSVKVPKGVDTRTIEFIILNNVKTVRK